MTLRYAVRPSADRDIDEIADYLADKAGLDMALQFLAEIYETFSLLAEQPGMGWACKVRHPRLVNARTFRVSSRFAKHLIFYQPHEDRIEILRVLHGVQDIEQFSMNKELTEPSIGIGRVFAGASRDARGSGGGPSRGVG